MSYVVKFTCPEHGEIWSAAAYCQHDVEDVVRRVAEAHHQPYGADCHASITVVLLDPETMLPADQGRRVLFPPAAPPEASSS